MVRENDEAGPMDVTTSQVRIVWQGLEMESDLTLWVRNSDDTWYAFDFTKPEGLADWDNLMRSVGLEECNDTGEVDGMEYLYTPDLPARSDPRRHP